MPALEPKEAIAFALSLLSAEGRIHPNSAAAKLVLDAIDIAGYKIVAKVPERVEQPRLVLCK